MPEKPLFKLIIFLINKITHFQIINGERIPPQGGVMMTTNHISRLDVPFLIAVPQRMDKVAIVAKKYQKKPFFRWVLEKIGDIVWMDRETTDFSALREVLNWLRKGRVVGIAPEGTRSHEGVGMLEGKQGAAMLAAKASVPNLPIGIVGTERVYNEWMKFRRPTVTIRVGYPYHLPDFDRENRQAWLAQNTDEIMCRIAMLLPPEYRGFYANHPRLQELLAEAAEIPE
jgi:1-acyl-sn-glycerol-3-phosphate acyltransferase